MYLPHFVVLLIILFGTMSLCMLADYLYVDRREVRRKPEIADVTQLRAPAEQKRAA